MYHFIHITDLHFWQIVTNPLQLLNKRILGNLNLILRRRKYVRTERAHSFLSLLDTMTPDAVLIGGDLTTTSTEAEYEQAARFVDHIAETGTSVYLIPGNHDVYTFESRRRRRFEKFFGACLPVPEKPVLSLLPGGVPLLRIPTTRPNIVSSRGGISRQQIAQSMTLLKDIGEGLVLVLAHYPLLNHTPAYRSGVARRLANATALREALGASAKPLLYLAGHMHAFSHCTDPVHTNITHVTSPALFYDKENHAGGFTEIEMEGGRIKLFPWSYRDGWSRGAESQPTVARG